MKYVFELPANCAVCGFEAFIRDKHIIGKIEEKQKAHTKYKEAMEQGKSAYLLDETDESNLFTLSVGNVPPQCGVVIKITNPICTNFEMSSSVTKARYIGEMVAVGECVLFVLPAAVAPIKQKQALKV